MAKGKKKIIQDQFFGELSFDVMWCGRIRMGHLGDIAVLVDGGNEGEPPTAQQREAVRQLTADVGGLENRLMQAVFDCYRENRESYLSDGTATPETPTVTSTNDIRNLLDGPAKLTVWWPERGEVPEVQFSWSTTFDPEHGVKVILVDGEIRDVGP
jgi:hypothetical protein